jgi:hypothetical protein
MKVFLDDERATPEGWTRVKTPEEAIELLKTDRVTHLSLDHDLGLSEDRTGYTVLVWIDSNALGVILYRHPSRFIPPMPEPGREWMRRWSQSRCGRTLCDGRWR